MAPSQELQSWIDAGEHRTIAGRRVFTRVQAAQGKPPLLLIHGFPTASYDWHLVWDALAQRYSLYALDLLGFGMSDKPADSRYSITGQADLCQAFLGEYDIRAAHVLAHDYGDTVAQELLARDAEGRARILSMCFLNGGLFPEAHRARPIQKLLAMQVVGPWLAKYMTYRGFEASMLRISGKHPPTREDLRDLWSLLERNGGRHSLPRLIGYMEQRRQNRARWVGALTDSRVPRRLICGAVDPVSGRHLAECYLRLVPRPDLVLLEDIGHYPQLEAPQRVVDEYFAFRGLAFPSSGRPA